MSEIVLVVCVLVVIAVVLAVGWRSNTENYGTVLGQLAPYAKQLNQCINECNRSDPNKRLLEQSNINCGMYCESVMTEMARRGVPPENIPIENNYSICERECEDPDATHEEKRKCISMCHGQREVGDWCKELWCPYSLFPEGDCMKQCISLWNSNNNQNSWTWDMAR